MSHQKRRILIVLIISFFLVKNFSGEIFLANSPRINKAFVQKLKNVPAFIASLPQKTFPPSPRTPSSSTNFQIEKVAISDLKKIPLKQISKGVYAGEQGKIQYYEISQNEIEWDQIELTTKSGRVVKLRYPKGQPPTEEMLNIIKSE